MNSLVSVIVPVYNAQSVLERCVDSILNQSYKNIEVILIDDGSTDGSCEICRKYERDSRVKYFYQNNGGVSSARNHGIKLASGDYIMFVDSDDYLKEECVTNLFVAAGNNNADFTFSGFELCHMKGDHIAERQAIIPESGVYSIKDFLLNFEKYRSFLNSPWKILYRRKILLQNEVSFPLNVHLGEDQIFVSEYLLYCEKICVIESSDYIYVISEAGTLSSKTDLIVPSYNLMCADYRRKLFEKNDVNIGNNEHSRLFYDTLIFNFIRVFSYRLSNSNKIKKKYCFMISNDFKTRELLKKYKGYNLKSKMLRFFLRCRMINCLYFMWEIRTRMAKY